MCADRRFMTWVPVLLLFVLRIGPAQAQSKPLGLWTGLGLGYGTARLSCSQCLSTNKGAPTGTLFLGGTASQWIRFGVETNVWVSHPDWLWNLSATAYWFPEPRSGFFVKGGAGMAQYHHTRTARGLNGTGIGVLAGLGYFSSWGKATVIGPVANVRYGLVGKLSGSQLTQLIGDVGLHLQHKW